MTGIAEPMPRLQHREADGPSDHDLVAAVRGGDDRAFEALYSRYHRRIQAYVFGMCKDHARAEDITQEIFVSALRRMRETERPIAFKPWIYEIAKNACIDQHRRSRRAEEVSLEADDALAPADYGRLVNSDPSPDVAVAAKQDLDHLCGAFGGLSETHHEILVMRELEGLSYREIGERLGMSRPAVESTLFRARRRLTEEYDELVSGERCLRIQGIIAGAGTGRLGARDSRRLARHVAHCQPCRREAIAAGMDANVLRPPLRTRVAAKVASWLPFPLFLRRGGGRGDGVTNASGSSGGWVAHLPAVSDQLGAGWGKAAAAVAILLAGVSAGVGTKVVTDSGHASAPPSAERGIGAGAPRGDGGVTAKGAPVVPASNTAGAGTRRLKAGTTKRRTGGGAAGTSSTSASTPASSGGSGQTPAASPAKSATDTVKKTVSTKAPKLAAPKLPASAPSLPAPVQQTVSGATQAAGGTVDGAVGTAGGVVQGAGDAVDGATNGATAPVTGAADDAVDDVQGTVGGLTP